MLLIPPLQFPSQAIHLCPNYDKDISLLSEGIDSLEQLFDTELENLTQMSPVKPNKH